MARGCLGKFTTVRNGLGEQTIPPGLLADNSSLLAVSTVSYSSISLSEETCINFMFHL